MTPRHAFCVRDGTLLDATINEVATTSPTRTRRSRTTVAEKAVAAKERLRKRFRPERVRILFVGESPPASGRFFYQEDSGLYRAIRETFLFAFRDLREDRFVDSFRSLGCYIVDLCERPVDRLDARSRRRACAAGEIRLARTIHRLDPEIIVAVVRSIGDNVRRAAKSAEWNGLQVDLPYPGRWHHYRQEFRRKLVPVLRATLASKPSLVRSVKRRSR